MTRTAALMTAALLGVAGLTTFEVAPASAGELTGSDVYGMQVPYIRSGMVQDSYVPVGRRYRVPSQGYVVAPDPGYDEPLPGSLKDGPVYGVAPDPYIGQDEAYSQEPPPPPPGRCISGPQIERMLVRQGWRDFSGPQKGVDVVGLTARRPNGLTYRLKLDRCTGVILQAYLMDQPDRTRTYSYGNDGSVPGY